MGNKDSIRTSCAEFQAHCCTPLY